MVKSVKRYQRKYEKSVLHLIKTIRNGRVNNLLITLGQFKLSISIIFKLDYYLLMYVFFRNIQNLFLLDNLK